MLGAFLFFIVFAFLCLLIRVPRSQHATPWWVEIATEAPPCTYYFGPFNSVGEAQLNQRGYIEDLQQEGAKGIAVRLEQGQPKILTICEEEVWLDSY
ncbi:MAG TPA: DUF1816 domain-containing protein [Chroococcales cyanobacterium]|jgi:hypothetical protein